MRQPDVAVDDRLLAAAEAAGINAYCLLKPGAVAPTSYHEVGVAASSPCAFALLSVEEVPVPGLPAESRESLYAAATAAAARWGLLWRGSIEPGRVQIAFGGRVRVGASEDAETAGLRLHDAILGVHHAHASFRQRVLVAGWRNASLAIPVAAPA